MEFIASSVVASAKLGIRNPALDALFAGTAVGVLRSFNAEATVDENTVASMLPSVLDMARIKGSPDVQAASYIVLLQLSSQVELSAEATDGILEVVARHRTKQSGELAVRTILYLCLSQQALTSFSNKTFKQLVVDLEPSELWAAAQAMVGERKDSEAVVAGVCTRFVAFFLDKFLVEPFWNSEEQRGTLVSWLKSDKLPAAAVENFCRSFVRKLGKTMAATDEPVDDADQEDDSAAKLAPFTTIAQTLESHWRSPLHAALDAFNADSSLRQFFQGDVSNEYAVPGSTANLVVDLNSANRASRLGAFTHLFAKLAQGGSEDLVELAKENVLRRLKMDDDKDVLVLILSQDILADLFAKDSEDVTEEMRRLVEESESKKVREAAFKSLVNLEGKGAGEFGKSEAFVLGQCVVSKKVGSMKGSLARGKFVHLTRLSPPTEPRCGSRLSRIPRRSYYQIEQMDPRGSDQGSQTPPRQAEKSRRQGQDPQGSMDDFQRRLYNSRRSKLGQARRQVGSWIADGDGCQRRWSTRTCFAFGCLSDAFVG